MTALWLVAAALAISQTATAVEPTVVFVCEHGAAKSVIATAYFNKIAAERGLRARAVYRGVNPQADLSVTAMKGLKEDGLAVDEHKPSPIAQSDIDNATVIFAIGCTLPANATASRKAASWDDVPDEFWDNYEIVTGKTAPPSARGSFFSCCGGDQ